MRIARAARAISALDWAQQYVEALVRTEDGPGLRELAMLCQGLQRKREIVEA